MEKGDIDNRCTSPEVWVVWEGLVSVPGPRYTPERFRRYLTWRAWDKAINLFEPNPEAVTAIWDMWAAERTVGIVTYQSEQLVPAIIAHLHAAAVPYARFTATTLAAMTAGIAVRRDIHLLCDPDPARRLSYGPKGRTVSPVLARRIGSLA